MCNCEFANLQIGDVVVWRITDPCRECGIISSRVRRLCYEGHITDGIVYDFFRDIGDPCSCPSCGMKIVGWVKPCWADGCWDVAEIFGAAAKEG